MGSFVWISAAGLLLFGVYFTRFVGRRKYPTPTREQLAESERRWMAALTSVRHGDYAAAVREWRAARELDHSSNVEGVLARALVEMGDVDGALQEIRACRPSPLRFLEGYHPICRLVHRVELEHYHVLMASTLQRCGRKEEAYREWEIVSRLPPSRMTDADLRRHALRMMEQLKGDSA